MIPKLGYWTYKSFVPEKPFSFKPAKLENKKKTNKQKKQ